MKRDPNEARNSTYKMIFIGTGLTGLVTIVILGVAIAIGLFLDNTFGSDKHIFTVVAVILSIPVTIMGLLWSARFTAQRYGVPPQETADSEEKEQEDA
jgi:O-antigen/teichoic acid export membrane protein